VGEEAAPGERRHREDDRPDILEERNLELAIDDRISQRASLAQGIPELERSRPGRRR
jgi:hypothetical protein